MLPLACKAQQYAWGKKGSESMVAKLKAAGESAEIDESAPYAEYWFGTHPNGPSVVKHPEGEEPLHDFLMRRPDALGVAADSSSSALPYLFKVLSVAKALSIQAHPDKALAGRLHAARPDVYRDPNHKPEMALALTPFEAMCGFRSVSEIAANLESCPELAALLGEEAAAAMAAAAAAEAPSDGRSALRAAFAAFMARADDEEAVKSAVSSLVDGLEADEGRLPGVRDVVLRLQRQFPGDIGVFSPLWLNVVTLEPGQAIFLAANEPHAYLAGDCVECMACSDNVVRAGLTPKLKDVPTLVSMLTYTTGTPTVYEGEDIDECTKLFAPPVPEFAIQRVAVPAGRAAAYELPAAPSAAILLCVEGEGTASVSAAGSDGEATCDLRPGRVFLEPFGSVSAITASSDLLFFRVHTSPSA